MSMEMFVLFLFFLAIRSRIFPPFSLSLSLPFRMVGHLIRARMALTGLHSEATMVNRTFLVRTFDHFFLTLQAFCALL